MKKSVKDIIGFKIGATDGEIGTIKDFFFDDQTWTVRYIVVDTGNWLFGRKVLLAPQALLTPDWHNKLFPVNLTKDQVKHSPDIDTEQPVTRQEEARLYEHYPWTSYWGGGLWAGGLGTSGMVMPAYESIEQALDHETANEDGHEKDRHLRSTQNVKGYSLKATDDSIGDVEDFVLDVETWKINYLVVDTGNWLPGKKVIISPRLIKDIEWETSSVVIDTTAEYVKNSPEYDPENFSEVYETNLQNYYGNYINHDQQ